MNVSSVIQEAFLSLASRVDWSSIPPPPPSPPSTPPAIPRQFVCAVPSGGGDMHVGRARALLSAACVSRNAPPEILPRQASLTRVHLKRWRWLGSSAAALLAAAASSTDARKPLPFGVGNARGTKGCCRRPHRGGGHACRVRLAALHAASAALATHRRLSLTLTGGT
jgi:hypothetical protein